MPFDIIAFISKLNCSSPIPDAKTRKVRVNRAKCIRFHGICIGLFTTPTKD